MDEQSSDRVLHACDSRVTILRGGRRVRTLHLSDELFTDVFELPANGTDAEVDLADGTFRATTMAAKDEFELHEGTLSESGRSTLGLLVDFLN